MEASVFFTFWGLFAIVKPGVRVVGDNWMQKMMAGMNPGSAQKAKLSRYHFAGAGPAMFKKLADDHRVARPEEPIETAFMTWGAG
ncbi:MAG: DsrE/DsrF/DrsH-like family protein [Actinomycetota bacterium]